MKTKIGEPVLATVYFTHQMSTEDYIWDDDNTLVDELKEDANACNMEGDIIGFLVYEDKNKIVLAQKSANGTNCDIIQRSISSLILIPKPTIKRLVKLTELKTSKTE